MNTEHNNTVSSRVNPYSDENLLKVCLCTEVYGPLADTLTEISNHLNCRCHWSFSEEDLCGYRKAFNLMNANQPIEIVLGVLPERRMTVCEPQRKNLFKILKSNPNLIKAYIIERLTDANFHTECRDLIAMDCAA